MTKFALAALAALTLAFPVAVQAKTKAPAKPKTLYKRLGEKKAIKAVVDEFVTNCATDERINTFFKDTAADKKRLAKFKTNLVEQICQATGGPCKYKGMDMKTAHKDMKITETHFNALVEDLTKALDKFKVPETEKGELLGALAGMKGDIVTATETTTGATETKPETGS